MRRNLLVAFLFLILASVAGCATFHPATSGVLDQVVVTNAQFIVQTMRELKLPEMFKPEDIVVLASLENMKRDMPINYLVEDVLTEKLLAKSVRILERNPHAVAQLAMENRTQLLPGKAFHVRPTEADLSTIRLSGASRLLTYRVYRAGVQYVHEHKIVGDETRTELYRVARVELWLRIVDVGSSQDLWAGVIEAEKKEKIEPELLPYYETDEHKLFEMDLPNAKKGEGECEAAEKEEHAVPPPPKNRGLTPGLIPAQ